MIRIKRVYEQPEAADGVRILVDRLWPRGVAKESARFDEWCKEIAPSNELRQWFGHDPARWEEFRIRYLQELTGHKEILTRLQNLAQKETVTLLYAARDEAHNNAVVLKELIE
ncbi:DUF488 domain-containing protein [Geobacter pelophilus]|uniref:DUF488 domain-containing protein n=1 Tax=Geoanaerobacter pelophilus TaxID=60036 RepID=A0AAW4L3A3_9BACT|nr:DUF488 domain-containing protein [Geoanaerobacter pelophilus]MBT0664682.1 DUF488 domain-containing protein [Geoanaerobacter pelophilus]